MGPFDTAATVEYLPAARVPAPVYDTTDIVIAAPPEVARHAQPNQLIRFLPIVTAIATVGAMAVAYYARSPAARNPAFLMFPLMMLVSAVATALSGADRRRGEINAGRAEYLGYLSDVRARTVKAAEAQQYSLAWSHPDPDTLWSLVGGWRMWERRVDDADFCQVRIGVGTLARAARLVPSTVESTKRQDPVGATALRHFLSAHSTISNAPIAISLRGVAVVSVGGDATRARALLRATICQLAVMHSPRLVLIAAAVSDRSRADWDWLKWLPHNRHPCLEDDLGSARMVYASLAAAEEALACLGTGRRSTDPSAPHLLVVVDGDVTGVTKCANDIADKGVTLLTVEHLDGQPPADGAVRLAVHRSELVVRTSGDGELTARPDEMSYAAALACAQRLAGYRAGGVDASDDGAKGMSWQDLVGIGDVSSCTPTDLWRRRSPGDRLRVPIGTTEVGAPVELDIKEAAENGMGPHGLCIGATGSGKSEFLRTIAVGMIACHSPDELNLVLVDFKGGATFAGLEPAPHVAAVITNLSDKAALVTRMRDALTGEMTRRQELLREAGNLDGIAAYRRVSAHLAPLPTLFIIVDEFSEMLSQHPDFADVFVAIGRLGRSLGVHLLLASQRLDEGRLRGLESHLSYRVCLKTLSVNESRTMLGTSDAYELPTTPGAAYLRVGTDALVRFQTAYVSGPARLAAHEPAATHRVDTSVPVRLFTTEPVGPVTPAGRAETDVVERRTVLQAVVERLSGSGPKAHEVWLPPLGAAPALSTVLHDVEPAPALTVPVGVVDRPFEQRRTPLIVDMSGAAGNVAVVGAPQSGKSTALRTLITALAATHDPRMVQFYCLDFGGGALSSLRDWSHIGSVAGRADPQLARRMITWFDAIIRAREKLFRDHQIESMVHYRQLKEKRDPRCDRFGDVFLVVDGWPSLHREFETTETSIAALAAEGLSFGVHVVISASRWAEVRPALRDQIGTRIELRLGDPADSELDRRRAQDVPEGQPGRGLSHDGLHMVIALPDPGADLLRDHSDGWIAPPIPLLPARVEHDSIVERGSTPDSRLLIGIEETELQPVAIDFTQQPHLLIIGDSECGKSATLRTVCRELLRTTTGAQCQLFVVDVRRSLLGAVDPESGQLGGYCASANAIGELMPQMIEQLRRRMPPSTATVLQLRNRSWWSGPEMYVVVDDYDLVGSAGGNPLAALVEVLPHARDVGLHVVVARRSGGATRAMFEPLLGGLRDAGAMTLLMSGNPDDGLTIGSVRQSQMAPGRGTLITRRDSPRLIQVGWSPPP
ncbi:MAG TPA: type VII secretion protein EccCa [Mycobacterium sp.]|uniref:type VII secretion protein EccCa n=1 Tax=Mycobacterium sp. TaxID=1785 RepID=UPI002F414F2F